MKIAFKIIFSHAHQFFVVVISSKYKMLSCEIQYSAFVLHGKFY